MALVVDEFAPPAPEVVAGRYRIEKRIANGGMGAVYRAFDRVQQREIALKRLRVEGDARRRTRMFEREFHTLAGLKHPRIIEVYDYGIDERGAYYTMELLDGRDLRDLAPLAYKDACFYLRDVASSLALVHARGLLHRDLSPRNVRVTSNGRAKLIDFGALSGFGRNQTLVGTAPLIPPEALYGGELDPRADLYALGALAYWVLTGRHAYDVRSADQLPNAWEAQLFPPSDLLPAAAALPALPPELDQLIMSLLSQNPLARPASASEVIARLSSIAELTPDEEPLSVLSYLRGGRPVGRFRERSQLRKRLKGALAGHGSVVEIDAEAGMGVSRMLADLAIEARMSGCAAVVIDASMHRGAYAVADELARGVLCAQPDKARSAAQPHETELLRFIADSRVTTQRVSTSLLERTSTDPRESRMRTQAALLAWLDDLAAQVPLMIAVHNLGHADDNSLALLAALARGVASRRMLIVLGRDPDQLGPPSVARASLHESALHMRLRGLEPEEVRSLVEASFGIVQNGERLAAWLHQVTAGKPQSCLDLMQHLVEHGVIRFIEGVWVLPQELGEHDLPLDLAEALSARFARLSEPAQRMARALSVQLGAVPLERCLALAERIGIESPRAALSELAQHGIVLEGQELVRFGHSALRNAVLATLSDEARKRLHAQLGHLLSQQNQDDPEGMLEAGWHLMHGGEEVRGADMLAEAGVALSIHADGLPEAIPALRAALEIFQKQRRGKRELARLLSVLSTAGFFTDRSIIEEYGDRAASAMQDVLGLTLGQRLSRVCGAWLGPRLGLAAGLLRVIFQLGPRKGVAAFRELVQLFVQLILALTGLGTITLDAPRSQRYASMLEPLRLLGPDHAGSVIAEFAGALAFLPEDRVVPTIHRLRKVIARLDDSKRPIRDMTDEARTFVLGAALYALGALEGLRESPEVLAIADRLDSMGRKLFELLANQIRASYHALRGDLALWELYRRRVEIFAIQAGSGWQAELWAPTSEILAYYRARDLVGIRRVMGQLERLAKDIPSLDRHAKLAVASYYVLRGEHAISKPIGESVLASSEPRSFIGWSACLGGQMRDLIDIGDAQQARQIGLSALALLDAEDRTVSTMVTSIVVELAAAEAALGELQPAAARVEAYLAELGDRAGATTRGILHEARARIAQLANDTNAARRHLAEVDRCFRPSDNPALVARAERLRRELEGSGVSHAPSEVRDTLDLGLPNVEDVLSLVRRSDAPQKRYESALELLLEHTGSPTGHLFAYDGSELRPSAPRDAESPPAELAARAHRALESWLQLRSHDKTESGSEGGLPTLVEAAEDRYRIYVIGFEQKERPVAMAVVALAHGRRPLRAPAPALLAALAEALAEPATASTQPPRLDSGEHDTDAGTFER